MLQSKVKCLYGSKRRRVISQYQVKSGEICKVFFIERLKCEKMWCKFSFKSCIHFFLSHGSRKNALQLGLQGANRWEFLGTLSDKSSWLEFHKTVKYNYYIIINLLLQFATLFPGHVDLQARATDKYVFGLWKTCH